ncbi:hypothetical protein AGMMS50233_09200 [Endomicrobiia bacterium]|nr:hypothetical protein AGMMS50233_09200 [Endomicrobiia bacterium]
MTDQERKQMRKDIRSISSVSEMIRREKEKLKREAVPVIIDMVFDGLGGVKGLIDYLSDPLFPDRKMQFYTKMYGKRIPQALELTGSRENDRPINIHLPAEAAKI